MFRFYDPRIALLLLAAPAWAAEKTNTVTINNNTYSKPVAASAVPSTALSAEQALRFKKVFLFPSVDDVGGVIAAGLDEKLAQVLSKGGQFDLVRDNAVVRALSPDEASYAKVAQNPDIHREAAKVTGADTTALLRTKNIGNETQMTLEFRDASGELLFAESGTIPGFSSMDVRGALLKKLNDVILKKLPFEGVVSGRTMNTITIDLGLGRVQVGDDLDLIKIVSFQRHPLLKTIVNIDYVRVGRARVVNVDRLLSFAEITEEIPGERINTNSKILTYRQISSPVESLPQDEKRRKRKHSKNEDQETLPSELERSRARYGSVSATPLYGFLTQTQNNGSTSVDYKGSGIGAQLQGELWMTRNWILNVQYEFQNMVLLGPGITGASSAFKKFELLAGYRLFPMGLEETLSITGYLGIQNENFDIPINSAVSLSGKQYSGLVLRLDGQGSISENQKIGGGFEFLPMPSFTDSGSTLGQADSATVIAFHFTYFYMIADNLWLKGGIEFDSASGTYVNSTASVTDKRFAFGPGIQYSF